MQVALFIYMLIHPRDNIPLYDNAPSWSFLQCIMYAMLLDMMRRIQDVHHAHPLYIN